MSARRRSKSSTREQLSLAGQLLEGRALQQALTRLEDHTSRREQLLKQLLRPHLERQAIFDQAVPDSGHPSRRIIPAGEGRLGGFKLAHTDEYRLVVQETLTLGADGTPRIGEYSYQFVFGDGNDALIRFEYHPDLGKAGEWSTRHHLHVNGSVKLDPELERIHFPIAPFLDDPPDPVTVLNRVLHWSVELGPR